MYIEFCLYYRLAGDTGGVRGFDSASTRDGRPVLFRELMSVISSWYSSRSEVDAMSKTRTAPSSKPHAMAYSAGW